MIMKLNPAEINLEGSSSKFKKNRELKMKIELSKMRKTSPVKSKGKGGFKSITASGIYDPIEIITNRSNKN